VNRLVLLLFACAACGDNTAPPLQYENPSGGKLRLVRDARTSPTRVVLDLVVGDQPLTGYSVGFDLPLDDTKVALAMFTPGTALDPGTDPIAATGAISTTGPLAHQLVTGLSQKASGAGAAAGDTEVKPGAVLYKIELGLLDTAASGIVFDGTASGFVLRSGGMRDRLGNTVVDAKDVALGKLVVHRD
jgi:hypothetical protein